MRAGEALNSAVTQRREAADGELDDEIDSTIRLLTKHLPQAAIDEEAIYSAAYAIAKEPAEIDGLPERANEEVVPDGIEHGH
jgi:hypothetical protein